MTRAWRRAFTLIELLVVIAIIAILIGMLLPAVQRVRDSANSMRCKKNLQQLALAVQAFHTEYGSTPTYNGLFPLVRGSAAIGQSSTTVYGSWFVHLMPFVDQHNMYDEIYDETSRARGNNGRNGSYAATGTLVTPAQNTVHAPASVTGSVWYPAVYTPYWDPGTTSTTVNGNGQTITISSTPGMVTPTTPDAGTNTWIPPRRVLSNYVGPVYNPPGSGPISGLTGFWTPERRGTKFQMLICNSDPSVGSDPQARESGFVYTQSGGKWGSTNYLANWNAFSNGSATLGFTAPPVGFDTFGDGTGNTILFSEAYSWCDGRGRAATLAWFPSNNIVNNPSLGGVHNFGITFALGNHTITIDGVPTPIQRPNGAPASEVNFMFQIRPVAKPASACPQGSECCNSLTVQSPHQTLNVAMADGSVRSISGSLSPNTWKQALLPNDGEVMGSDW